MGWNQNRRRLLRTGAAAAALAAATVFGIDARVRTATRNRLFSAVGQVPHRKVGLLLGTSKWLPDGRVNRYYQYRIEAALALYRAGKIDFILVSGDNSTSHYNEPESMRDDLVAAGVPAHRIYLDYAGFRTLDSIVRCKEVFGEQDVVIISQPFHNARALFLADEKGLRAIAFNARDVEGAGGAKTLLREKFARTKMALDLLVGKEPKFYGPRVAIR